MRVALVHDYLNQYGGAERVLDEFHEMWPDAPIFTTIYDPSTMPERYRDWDIRTAGLNRLPWAKRHHQALLPMLPGAFEKMDLSGFDLVLSSSSGFAHGVHTGPETCHVCYSHSPPRFLWDYGNYSRREGLSWPIRAFVEANLAWLRTWDRVAAERTDAWISTSELVKARLAKFYGKSSKIIPPPIEVGRFEISASAEPGDYLLVLMRLVGWKRADIVVDACTQLGLPLIVAGDGRELEVLRRRAGPNVRFVGRVNDDQMRILYRDCRAFILPSEEDFGITPLEAMASGRPVIAYGRGGVRDTVLEGVTGVFFDHQTAESVKAALSTFDANHFNPQIIRAHAEGFDSAHFRRRILSFVDEALAQYRLRFGAIMSQPPLS